MLAQIYLGERSGDCPGGGRLLTGPPRFLGLVGVIVGGRFFLLRRRFGPAILTPLALRHPEPAARPIERTGKVQVQRMLNPVQHVAALTGSRSISNAARRARADTGQGSPFCPIAIRVRGSWSACPKAARTALSRDRRGPAESRADRRRRARSCRTSRREQRLGSGSTTGFRVVDKSGIFGGAG